jgi:hypothetical protein
MLSPRVAAQAEVERAASARAVAALPGGPRRLSVAAGTSVAEAVAELRRHASVAYAVPNFTLRDARAQGAVVPTVAGNGGNPSQLPFPPSYGTSLAAPHVAEPAALIIASGASGRIRLPVRCRSGPRPAIRARAHRRRCCEH